MQYRTLGRTGMRVSVIGLGTWQFGGEWGHAYTQGEVDAVFDAARDCGINLLDTAECYGDHLSEKLCGQAIKKDRERWVVATKFGHQFHANFERTEPRRPEDIQQQLEASLKALQTEAIDLYQYHSFGSSEFFDDDVLAVLHKAKDAGKVRHLGNSARNKDDQHEQVAASQQRGIEAVQLVYNRLQRLPEENGTLDLCRQQNLGVLARVPLASGYLSGKYDPEAEFAAGEVRGRHDPEHRRSMLESVQQIARDEVPEGTPMAQWALAWCLQHPAVTCVIPGCKRPAQVENNAAVASLDLAAGDHPQAVGD
jgi:aryl-alcohol dehydrogenase-like predicted oxidoreductase